MRLSRVAMGVMLALGVQAQAGAFDLADTYHAAQGQDAVFASARAAQQAGREKLPQGRALLMPSVNLSASRTKNDITTNYAPNPTFPLPSGPQHYFSRSYGATLTQPLFREQNWAAYNEAELQVAISDAQFRQAEQDVILRSAQAYFDVLIAQDTVQLTAAQKTAITQQLEQARRNFEVGSATITDTYEAQARYDLIVAQELAAANNLEVKRRTLQQLINGDFGELSPLGGTFKLEPPDPADVQKWVADAQQGSPQIAVARASYELSEQEVARNRGGHLPTVDLVASYSNTANSGGNAFTPLEQRVTAVGVQLNMPLFQGGAIQSKWREAEAKREQSRQDLENARRSVELQTRQSYLGVVNGIAQVQALQQALKSSESLLDASKLGQKVGVRTNLDVLNAQQQMYSTRRDLYQAQYNYLVSRLRLAASTGTLGEADLDRVNQALH